MDLGVYQLRHFSISCLSSLLGTDSAALSLDTPPGPAWSPSTTKSSKPWIW